MRTEDVFVEARRLFAEDQPIASLKMSIVDGLGSRGFNKKEARRIGNRLAPLRKAGVDDPRKLWPIVQARAADTALIEFKTHGLDQVQLRTGSHTRPTDIAGVFRYQRLHQHHPTKWIWMSLRAKSFWAKGFWTRDGRIVFAHRPQLTLLHPALPIAVSFSPVDPSVWRRQGRFVRCVPTIRASTLFCVSQRKDVRNPSQAAKIRRGPV